MIQIADDELRHSAFWKKYTGRDAKPSRWSLWKYYLISRIFGVTFGIKLMEKGEGKAQVSYEEIARYIPAATDVQKEEKEHESKLIDLIDEERLRYVGSMVLGLNDALANSRPDYRERLEKELAVIRHSEMWQAGAAVRSLRPENWRK